MSYSSRYLLGLVLHALSRAGISGKCCKEPSTFGAGMVEGVLITVASYKPLRVILVALLVVVVPRA
jgi:hypothetical protein